MGEHISETNLTRRFVDAINKQSSHLYSEVITLYEGQMIKGELYMLEQLREFLALKYGQAQAKDNKSVTHEMKGFANVRTCTHCGKTGHSKESCWKLERKNFNTRKDINKPRKHSNIQCWNCGREGNIRRDCHKKGQ